MERKNLNRGYKKLNVWNDGIELYCLVFKVLLKLPLEFKKVTSNAIDAAQSITRNIAEGYCRRSIKEYIQFLYYALGSYGELHSSLCSFLKSGQLSAEDFETIDELHYKTENELIQLVKSLQRKSGENIWNDNLNF